MKYDEYDVIKIQLNAPIELINGKSEIELADEVQLLRDELEKWFAMKLKNSRLRAVVLYPTDEL